MKCVIVALALLCSAQALKMDREPMSARARKHVETFDRIDRKAGRPERSKVSRAEFKKAAYEGTDEDLSDGVISGVFDWATDNGMDTAISGCQVTNSNAVDLMLCVGDDLASSSGAGINDAFCAETDAWNTDAADICEQTMSGSLSDSAADFESTIAAAKATKKKQPFDYAAKLTAAAAQYLDGYGIIDYVQGILDGYSFYCDEVTASAMAELADDNELGKGESKSSGNRRSWLLGLTEANVAVAEVLDGAKSFGERLRIDYDAWATMKLPAHVNLLLTTDVRSRLLKSVNFQAWRKGQFRRLGRKPQ
jgi:hypothetical protein